MPGTLTSDPAWDALVKSAVSSVSEGREIQRELGESAKVKSALAERIIDAKPPPAPEIPPPVPPPQAPKQSSPFESFGRSATVLGILGGLLTRAPLTASLNAATSAMNAYKQRDLEAYRQSYETWKAQSDYLAKVSDWQQKQYQMVLDEHKGNVDQALAGLNAIAARDQDIIMQHTIATGDLRNVIQLMTDRDKANTAYARTQAYLKDVNSLVDHRLAQEQEAKSKVLAATQKQQRIFADGKTLIDEIERMKTNITNAETAGVPTSGKLGYLQSMGEALNLSEGDIATRINSDKAALRLKVESFLRRSRPNRYSEQQIADMIKGYGFMETGKATITGLNSLEQTIKDEISAAGEDAGAAVPGPTVGSPLIMINPGGASPPVTVNPKIQDEAEKRYKAIFGGDE